MTDGIPHSVKKETHTMSSNIDHPDHYGSGDYETIKVIDAWGLDFSLGNAVKYISRAGKKEGATKEEDLRKAVWYLNHEIGEDKPIGDVPEDVQKFANIGMDILDRLKEFCSKVENNTPLKIDGFLVMLKKKYVSEGLWEE